MAQLNITLNQGVILQLLRESGPNAIKNLLQEHSDSRNGTGFHRPCLPEKPRNHGISPDY